MGSNNSNPSNEEREEQTLFHSRSVPPLRHPLWHNQRYLPSTRVVLSGVDFKDPLSAALRTADQVESMCDIFELNGRKYENYAIIPENICETMVSMSRHPLDGSVIWSEMGVKAWASWSEAYFGELACFLDERLLPVPALLPCCMTTPIDVWSRDACWWDDTLSDPRCDKVDISGGETLLDHTIGFSGINMDRPLWGVENASFRSLLARIRDMTTDWNMHRAVFSYAEEYFPGILCSNKGLSRGVWLREWPDMSAALETLWTPVDAPVLFPIDHNMATPRSFGDWGSRLGIPMTGNEERDMENISAALAAQLTLSVDRTSSLKMPWLPYPGQPYSQRRGQRLEVSSRYFKRTMGIVREAGCSHCMIHTGEALRRAKWSTIERAIG